MTNEWGGRERGGNDDGNYVHYLETKMNKLVDEVGGERGNLRKLRITYKWTEDNIDISKQVIKFCSEYLIPRYKFLEKGWIVHNPDKENRFSMFVKRHLPLPDDVVFEEKWDILIAPSIVKKYTDMRCNINAFVRDTSTRCNTPIATEFMFELTPTAAENNQKVFAWYNFDLEAAIAANSNSPLSSYGSEFRPLDQVQHIFHRHPLWTRMESYCVMEAFGH